MSEVRLIDANALAESDMAKLIDIYLYNQCNLTVGLAAALMPTIEPEVRRGRWIDNESRCYPYKCTSCNTSADWHYKFCPYCGADMREEGADNG